MLGEASQIYEQTLCELRDAGLEKIERELESAQGVEIRIGGRTVLNFCNNNYLGLAAHPEVRAAAHAALDRWGFGLAAGRLLSGTQTQHRELERRLAGFVGSEDAILFSSCFDANGGLFEALLGPDDAVLSDALNHASIIDGIRLCKAARYRYANCDLTELERLLVETQSRRLRLIATDGVFSMDGALAPLDRICALAQKYRALVMVDDSHATGIVGPRGRGTPEHFGVTGEVDLLTSTLGKALGGAAGGFAAGRGPLVAMLRQRARPYIFSNSLPPVIVGASLRVLDLLEASSELRERLQAHTRRFRQALQSAGFRILGQEHPLVPVLLGDAHLANAMAAALFDQGINVVGFAYPIVPPGQARIRVQLSAAHSREHIERAIEAFVQVGRQLAVL
ncbi:MAG TPA: glycine C-acetyltransferase [Polyangia bacterium]|nr:glycine C-acetyltransferase [Polyangia bacterium]